MSADAGKGQAGQENAPESQKKRPKLGLIVVIVLAVAAGAYYYMSRRAKVATDDAQVYGHDHAMAFQVPGRVLKVHVDDNQIVEPGQLLVELDPADYEAAVNRAAGMLQQAQAAQAAAEQELKILQVTTVEDLVGAKAQLASSQEDANKAKAHLAQMEFEKVQIEDAKQRNPGAVSLQRFELSKNAFDSAQAAVDAAAAAVAIAESGVRTAETGPEKVAKAEAEVAKAKAAVQSAEASLETAQLNLSYCKIYAPVKGQITKKSVEPGNFMMPGTPTMSVIDMGTTWVLANYKETQLEELQPGQRVQMRCDIYPGFKFEGVIDSLDAGTGAAFGLFPPQNATGNYVKIIQRVPVKVVIPADNRDSETGEVIGIDGETRNLLRIGMNIVATAYVAEGEGQ
jgi:membrane fusion protein (multidrug efflux system)